MSETVERIYPEAVSLRSVAKMERKKGNVELAHVIEGAADLYERTASDLESASKSLHSHSAVVIEQHAEISKLTSQLDEAQKQLEIKAENDAAFGRPRFDVLKYSFDLVSHYREADGSITNQMAVNLSHMMAHSFNNVRLQWAESLGFMSPGDLESSVRSFTSQLEEARARTDRLSSIIEAERSQVAERMAAARKSIERRQWMREGRGPYEWNDDDYRREFSAAAKEFLAALAPLRKISADLSDCRTNQRDVNAARNLTAVEEARAKAIEECAQVAENCDTLGPSYQDHELTPEGAAHAQEGPPNRGKHPRPYCREHDMSETTYFSCGQCGREWHDAGRFKCECGNDNFMAMTLHQETTQHERDLVAKDVCPRCRGDLDTGWECNDCGYDAGPIARSTLEASDRNGEGK